MKSYENSEEDYEKTLCIRADNRFTTACLHCRHANMPCLASCPAKWRCARRLAGQRLGTYLTIEGVRAEKGKVGLCTLLVHTVNGENLDKPVAIWIDNADLPPLFRCTINGYETVRMIGVPPAIEKLASEEGRVVSLPQAGWQTQLYFVALSDVALKSAALKKDPVAAVRSALPEGWKVLRVDENTYPRGLPEGKGKAIFLGRSGGEREDVIVYIMPAGYKDGIQPKERTAGPFQPN